jgi:hypothetical protein
MQLNFETEKKTMRITLKTILIAGTLFGFGVMQAQQATELAKHPQETLKFEVKLEGQDAQKIKSVSLYLAMKAGSVPTDQPGFTNGCRGGNAAPISIGIFRPEITIPDNIANGDYILIVTANADPGSTDYVAGKQFQLHDFHIENPKTFTPPSKIEVKEVH